MGAPLEKWGKRVAARSGGWAQTDLERPFLPCDKERVEGTPVLFACLVSAWARRGLEPSVRFFLACAPLVWTHAGRTAQCLLTSSRLVRRVVEGCSTFTGCFCAKGTRIFFLELMSSARYDSQVHMILNFPKSTPCLAHACPAEPVPSLGSTPPFNRTPRALYTLTRLTFVLR